MDMFELLREAPYGAYAVDMRQTILFWNPEAERILGYRADQVIGRKCHSVIRSLAKEGSTPICMKDCRAVLAFRRGCVPSVVYARPRCASGERKRIVATPMVVPMAEGVKTVFLQLFHEATDEAPILEAAATVKDALSERGLTSPAPPARHSEVTRLSAREQEVLRLLALGFTSQEIAERLFISYNTVRKHVSNVNTKLESPTTLNSVLTAQRRGLI